MNKHQSSQGGAKIQPEQLKNVVNKMFNSDGMQSMINNIQNSTRGGGAPDVGALIGSILQSVNPTTMFEDLQNVVKAEIPQIITDAPKGSEKTNEEKIYSIL